MKRMKKSVVIKVLLPGMLAAACLPAEAQRNKGCFQEAGVGEIRTEGWLKKTMEIQRDGLTGHAAVMHNPFDTEGWGFAEEKKLNHWAGYEQAGYWADGTLRLGYLIGDPELTKKVKEWITYRLEDTDENGFIGPGNIDNLWPEVVFFRAVMAEYSATKDKKILEALSRNYRGPKYADLIAGGHEFGERMMLHVEIMCWLYGQTGDDFFLTKAEDTYRKFCGDNGPFTLQSLLSDAIPRTHSVSYCENLKIPAILYMYTGKPEYLNAALHAVEKIYRYYGLIDGLPSGNEYHDGNFSNEVHETCTVSDMQWALGYLLQATGDAKYADIIEKICFNAALGSVTKDFKAFQYYSGPNQFIADNESSHWNCHEGYHEFGKIRCSYRIEHGPACCGGNLNRMLPVFGSRMWMTKGTDGIVAALYSPSVFTIRPQGLKQTVTIREETNYPFDETIRFRISMKKAADFGLWLRIPGWCKDASIRVNGEESGLSCTSGTYVEVRKKYKEGDVVELRLPMVPEIHYLPENGQAVQYGALVYSMQIPVESKVIETREHEGVKFETFNFKPAGKWNYALLNTDRIRVIRNGDYSEPWNPARTPVQLEADAVEITNWLLYRGVYTPVLPSLIEKGETRKITLVPLGATTLRITIFPDLNRTFSKMD